MKRLFLLPILSICLVLFPQGIFVGASSRRTTSTTTASRSSKIVVRDHHENAKLRLSASHARDGGELEEEKIVREVFRRGIYTEKPRLRGELHRAGAFLYPPLLGIPLYLKSKPDYQKECLLFSLAVEGIMVVSATLHTFAWQCEEHHQIARKADFAMIFVGIALFYSSMGKLLLGSVSIFRAIIEPLVWICAVAGVLTKWFVPNAPPWLNAIVFLIQGWACGPLVPVLFRTASVPEAVGMVLGGIFITLGATAYSIQWPRGHAHTHIFGPHEMFHLGTLFMFVSFWFTMWMRVAR